MGEHETEQSLAVRSSEILGRVDFPGYELFARIGHGGVFMQATYHEICVVTGNDELQWTRKWLISPHMTDSEIVQTAFKLCLTSMEHRTREKFRYRGKRIFGPHFDVEDLVTICDSGRGDAGARPYGVA